MLEKQETEVSKKLSEEISQDLNPIQETDVASAMTLYEYNIADNITVYVFSYHVQNLKLNKYCVLHIYETCRAEYTRKFVFM